MIHRYTCPHCGEITDPPADTAPTGNCDACGLHLFDVSDDCDCGDCQPAPEVGDIYENTHGLAILTPHGRWQITEEDALTLIQGLSVMLRSRLTRPWSAENPSTILSRGRNVRRDHEKTNELHAVEDLYT